jgi:hypothetical protein
MPSHWPPRVDGRDPKLTRFRFWSSSSSGWRADECPQREAGRIHLVLAQLEVELDLPAAPAYLEE